LHGHLGQRMGLFTLVRDQHGSLRVKSPHAPLAQPYHHWSALSKAKLGGDEFDGSSGGARSHVDGKSIAR
jgi:hypothetical protein